MIVDAIWFLLLIGLTWKTFTYQQRVHEARMELLHTVGKFTDLSAVLRVNHKQISTLQAAVAINELVRKQLAEFEAKSGSYYK